MTARRRRRLLWYGQTAAVWRATTETRHVRDAQYELECVARRRRFPLVSQAGARTRTISWDDPLVDPREIAALSGLDYLQSLIDARRVMPIAALMHITLERVTVGVAVFAGVPSDFHYNPIGSVHGGFAATLLDSALGCAVHTTLEAGFAYTTVELKVNYVRAMRASTGRVECEGRVIHVGKRLATAEARIVDTEGRLYAHGSTTCLVFPQSAST